MKRISLRFQKLAFALATCALVSASAVVANWGVTTPTLVTAVTTSHQTGAAPTKNAANTAVQEPTRDEFNQYLDRPLRQVLYDPPPPPPEVKQLPPLQVEVLGTVLEPDNSMAIVRSPQGGMQYKRIGELIGPSDSPANVLEIHSDSIVVEREKERLTLKVRTGVLQ